MSETKGKFDPYADALTGEDGRAACEQLIKPFTRVVRTDRDPPIASQQVGLISMKLFSTPKEVAGKPVYGLLKLRGNYGSSSSAASEAARLIKNTDSVNVIYNAPVGAWVPITENISACEDRVDVKTDDSQHALYDEASKEKKEERMKIMREIREREEELKNGADAYNEKFGLDFYVGRRVTEIRLSEHIAKLNEQIEQVDKKRLHVRKSLAYLEQRNPDHTKVWVERYNEERTKSGIPGYIPDADIVREYEEFLESYTPTEEDNPEDDTDRARRVAQATEVPVAAKV
jgi:hypothetical protein